MFRMRSGGDVSEKCTNPHQHLSSVDTQNRSLNRHVTTGHFVDLSAETLTATRRLVFLARHWGTSLDPSKQQQGNRPNSDHRELPFVCSPPGVVARAVALRRAASNSVRFAITTGRSCGPSSASPTSKRKRLLK